VWPPLVLKFDFEFDTWEGDEIVEGFPVYLVTEKLGKALMSAGVTGFELQRGRIGTSLNWKALYSHVKLPPFKWLKIVGDAKSDMYMTSDYLLAVSQKAFDIIMATKPTILEYQEI